MSDAGDLVRLAARGVLRNRRRTLVTGAMIALGVVAVIFARGFIAGLQVMITSAVIDMRHGDLEIARAGYHASAELAPLELDLPATGALADALAAAPGVAAVSPRLRFVGMVSRGEVSQIFTGVGVEPAADARVCPKGPASRHTSLGPAGERYMLAEGEGLGADDGVVLGPELAASLEAGLGDTITLMVQTQGGSMDAIDARVVGVFRWDQPDDNRRGLVVPLALAQRVLHMDGRATSFAVRASDRRDDGRLAGALATTIAGVEPAVELRTWRELAPYLRDVMTLQDRVLGLVMTIVFTLLVVGVATTMSMSAFERTREVGTLMCLGMRRRRIVGLFLVEAAILAALAGLAGIAIGVGLVRWAHHAGIPFEVPAVGALVNRPVVDPAYLGLALAAAVASSLLAALYPSWRASRLRPVEALRAT